MKKYKCAWCSYIYDSECGGPDSEIITGTPFEYLSDDLVCSQCGTRKSLYKKR